MNYAPLARIAIRYGVGAIIGAVGLDPSIAVNMSMNPDIVMLVAGGIAAAVEGLYALAKRKGWAT